MFIFKFLTMNWLPHHFLQPLAGRPLCELSSRQSAREPPPSVFITIYCASQDSSSYMKALSCSLVQPFKLLLSSQRWANDLIRLPTGASDPLCPSKPKLLSLCYSNCTRCPGCSQWPGCWLPKSSVCSCCQHPVTQSWLCKWLCSENNTKWKLLPHYYIQNPDLSVSALDSHVDI